MQDDVYKKYAGKNIGLHLKRIESELTVSLILMIDT